RVEEIRAPAARDRPAAGRRDATDERTRERDQRAPPRRQARVPDRHVCAEERDERRERDVQSLPLRLDRMAHLVQEDQQDDPDAELPAPDQRVRGDGDEEAEELQEDEAELDCEPGDRGDWRPDPVEELLPVDAAAGLDRPVVAVVGHDPLPIHSSPPSYTSFFQSGIVPLSVSIASRHAARASWRCGAETAMATLGSPIPTRPTRWWIATSHSSYFARRDSASEAIICSAISGKA